MRRLIAILLLLASGTLYAASSGKDVDGNTTISIGYRDAPAAGLRVRSVDDALTSWGSGVAVGKHDVLTAWHVVETGKIEVEVSGVWYVAETMRRDIKNDLCIVRVGSYLKPVRLADCHPATVEGSSSGGVVKEQPAEITGGVVTYSPAHGHSGAPVLREGKLIGLVVQIDSHEPPTFAVFVAASVLHKFVEGLE